MRSTLCAIIAPLAVVASPAIAQEAEGYWTGTLQIGATELPVGFNVERGEDGALTATLDSPAQGSFDIPVDSVSVENDTLTATIAALSGQYQGTWDAEAQSWNGTWTQAGQVFPLSLTRGERPDRAAAPQPDPLPTNWSIPSDDTIADMLQTRIAERDGAGYVVGVVEGDSARAIVAGNGFDENTIFEIGSITKVFTSLILAQMVLDGTVSLDDPVANFLSDGATVPTRTDPADYLAPPVAAQFGPTALAGQFRARQCSRSLRRLHRGRHAGLPLQLRAVPRYRQSVRILEPGRRVAPVMPWREQRAPTSKCFCAIASWTRSAWTTRASR